MAEHDRLRLRTLLALYTAGALAWLALARWVAPTLLVAEHSPGILASLKQYIEFPPALFITRDILGRWREYSGAVLIAIVLHMTIVLMLRRHDFRADESRPAAVLQGERRVSLTLMIISFFFLGVTALSGPRHDYFFYRQMWFEIAQGHDPWFKVYGRDGHVPLNAYGPLFNSLTCLSWLNPYAPKLMFAFSYIYIRYIADQEFHGTPCSFRDSIDRSGGIVLEPIPLGRNRRSRSFRHPGRAVLPGGNSLVGAGFDIGSGICLALGVLLKYQPIVLLPILILDRGRVRVRLLVVAVATIVAGLGLSCFVWGTSTLSPLALATSRSSEPLSIFYFVRGRYSPLSWFGAVPSLDFLAPYVLVLALLAVWAWSWLRRPDIEAATLVASVTTLLFYRTAYPQYQMMPYVLGSSWAVRHWDHIRGRIARVSAISCYFGWLAAFDLIYAFCDEGTNYAYWKIVRDVVGLPSFLIGCAFLAVVIRSATREEHAPHHLNARGS